MRPVTGLRSADTEELSALRHCTPLQKQSRLFATLETLDNGKPIRESRDRYPSGPKAFLLSCRHGPIDGKIAADQKPLGVCGQIIPWNFPLLMLAWKIAPALAMGNTVVLKPAEYTSLTALFSGNLSANKCSKGVVNINTGDGRVGEMIISDPNINKSPLRGPQAAGSGKPPQELENPYLRTWGQIPFIVFDDADLDSAVEGVVDAIWLNQGQVCCAGHGFWFKRGLPKIFKQNKARMKTLRVGDPMDKSTISALL